jgi:hypothetical protein
MEDGGWELPGKKFLLMRLSSAFTRPSLSAVKVTFALSVSSK